MKWQEAQNIYPDQWVKFEILNSMEQDNKEIIDEIALIGPVKDEDATRELLNCKNRTLVFHTSRDKVEVFIRKNVGLRRYL
ncbi:hypothetical protein GXP70_07915 [Paenibacillus lycopersici]|uniref:Uncharacterized protein n=1 Tax=Paenibacillus lycopersici TaxID=2704462 RepID=A0A6C0FWN9_9BACL|nr:hypothetical protein [Paenibacillus lycopersici]QHT59883.1 hypothetical protein GXP70_07915 [Paenibacillus lycopersici]